MLVGYARTSTIEQEAGFEAQLRELGALGCEKVFSEQVSALAVRDELQRALEFVREDDVLVVCKLDRLARSMNHLVNVIEELEEKHVSLRILDMQLDTSSPTGRLMVNVLGAVAEFERSMMLERQREGVAKAKAEGKYKGRKPTARVLNDRIRELSTQGIGPSEISGMLGVGRTSVYRALRATTRPVEGRTEEASQVEQSN